MNIVVTGGLGFVGNRLVQKLGEIKNGDEKIIVVDNLHTHVLTHSKPKIPEDIDMILTSVEQLEEIPVNMVYHFGMPSSSPMYRKDRRLIYRTVKSFVFLMEKVLKENAKLVLASSSSLYNGNPVPWREDMPIYPKDFYTEVRYFFERLAKVYHDLYGVSTIVLRFFSVYGPGEEHKKNYANLVSQFIWNIMNNQQPIIYGDGTQSRDFIFVDDVVDAVLKASELKGYDIFNVGFGKAYTLNELVDIINKKLGKNISPKYVENPIKNYVKHTLADMSKAKEKLGFKPTTSLEEGIEKCITYYKRQRL